MIGLKAVLAAVVALVCAAAYPAAAQNPAANPRIALVIGNETYRDRALATTANDAGLIAQTLQAAGFDVVGARDLDGQSLRTALRDFLDKASAVGPDMQAFVYLAGRGIQYDGDNYFVPIDAEIRRDDDAPIEAVRVSDFVHALATLPGRARIVVLDAARANPYVAEGAPLAPGLALVDPEPGVLIAFNAAPGTLAGDEQRPYGVFGKTLAGAMRQGGVDVAEVFDQTRILVNQDTLGALLPWSASKLDGPYFIFERAADAPPPPVLSAARTAGRPNRSLPGAAGLRRRSPARHDRWLPRVPRRLFEFGSGETRPRNPRGPSRICLLEAHARRRFAARLLDLPARLSEGAACRRRAPAPGDSLRPVRTAGRFRADGVRGPAAPAAGRALLRGAARLRFLRFRAAAAPAARLLRV